MDCSICTEQLNDTVVTICNHRFHKTCLTKWEKLSQSCPLCRQHLAYIEEDIDLETLKKAYLTQKLVTFKLVYELDKYKAIARNTKSYNKLLQNKINILEEEKINILEDQRINSIEI